MLISEFTDTSRGFSRTKGAGVAGPQGVSCSLPPGPSRLADPLRLQIIATLAHEPLCTCTLTEFTDAKQTVSHHLRHLREAGADTGEAEGRFTCYCPVSQAFTDTLHHLADIDDPGLPPRLRVACATGLGP